MGLTKDALRPRSDAGRGRRSGVQKDAARPGVIRRGIDFGGTAAKGAAVLRPHRRPAHGRKTQLGPGRRTSGGSCETRSDQPACLQQQDRRMSKMRPGCVSAMPRSMRNRSKRQTHSDRPSEDEAQGACSVPGVQRRERSTPTARPMLSE